MKKMKKVLALMLAVLMMLSITPAVFAEDAATEEETTVVVEDAGNEDSGLTAGDLFGGFFIKIGELLNTVFQFLANLFSGTSGTSQLERL